MKTNVLMILVVLVVPRLGWCVPTSQHRACKQAIRSVEKFVVQPKHKNEYYCSLHAKQNDYFVFRINSRHPEPIDAGRDWVGSNLVGYFAVRKSNGKVYNWDIAEDRVGLVPLPTEGLHPKANTEAAYKGMIVPR